MGKEIGTTVDKTVIEPMSAPIHLIEGNIGAIKRTIPNAIHSLISLPFRLGREALFGVGAGMVSGAKFVAKAALHAPVIPFTAHSAERSAVRKNTSAELAALKSTII